MRVYLDSSALIKREIDEQYSTELIETVRAFGQAGDQMVTSLLTTIEVSRVIRSRLESVPPAAVVEAIETALSGVTECDINDQVIGIARRLGPSTLRSLDAIHLATASQFDVDLVVGYDVRLLAAASELGFRILAPGTPDQNPEPHVTNGAG